MTIDNDLLIRLISKKDFLICQLSNIDLAIKILTDNGSFPNFLSSIDDLTHDVEVIK